MKKFMTVMNALDSGMYVKIEGHEYAMSEDNEIIIVGERFATTEDYKANKSTEIYLKVDYPINAFIQMCEKMDEADILGINATIALTKMTEQKRMIRNGLQ